MARAEEIEVKLSPEVRREIQQFSRKAEVLADTMQAVSGIGVRIAEGIEKLASDPEIEIEAGPALCPHCGKHNPVVTILNTEGSGNLEDWILLAECHECHHSFYGLVESWSMFQSPQALEHELNERAGNNGNV